MYIRATLFGLCLSVVAQSASGLVIFGEQKVVIEPTCAKEKTCDVKEVGFWMRDYSVDVRTSEKSKERNFGTALYAWYETTSFDTLEEYVFVQFIRGCNFFSTNVGGVRQVFHTIVRDYLGNEGVAFVHPEWTVDSIDVDPAYWSNPQLTMHRHHFLKWNKTPKVFPSDVRERSYGNEKPPTPRLYMTDFSGQGFYAKRDDDATAAYNVSLEYRTCLYRARDVPHQVEDREKISASPLVCHDWRSSYVFDHEKKIFNSPKEIVSECTVPARKETSAAVKE